MATFTKKAGDTIVGTSGADLILITLGTHAETGTINGSFGFDTLRFSSGLAGDLLFIGSNITGIERVQIGGGTGSTPTTTTVDVDIDASAALNALSLAGNGGVNVILGTLFHDTFAISAGADELYGGNGDDVFTIFSRQTYDAESVIDGEGGNDTLQLSDNGLLVLGAATYVESLVVTQSFTGGFDASAIFNDAGISMSGSLGANRLIGTELGDTIIGGGGRDTLEGGGGNDVFLIALVADHAVDEVVDGGDGVDEIRFTSSSSSGNNLVLRAGVAVERVVLGDAAGNTSGTTDLWVDARAVDNPLEIVGNNGNNRITGTAYADTLLGGGGFDLFFINAPGHHAAGEVIDGGAGLDEIALSNTAPATYVLQASTNVEFIRFTSQANVGESNIDGSAVAAGVSFQGTNGANRITGGSGNDTLTGFAGLDTLIGGDGDDTFQYSSQAELSGDLIAGGDGEDRLLLWGNDFYFLPASMTGVETVELGGSSAAARPTVEAGGLTAGARFVGSGTVWATHHDDTILGGSGNDRLSGQLGDDSVEGGAGDDRLSGGDGQDTLDGGDGSDTYEYFALLYEGDQIADSGASGIDTLELTFLGPAPVTALDPDVSGIERVSIKVLSFLDQTYEFDFSAVDQPLTLRSSVSPVGLAVMRGTQYGDRFELGEFRHRYIGGEGNDTFAGANKHGRYEGGDGEDTVWIASSFVLPSSWSGIESIVLTADLDNGTTTGTQAINLRTGSSPNGLELTGNDGENSIAGTRYDDTMTGNAGKDTLSGGLGNDVLEGGAGADSLLGGGGNDVFLGFEAGDRVRGDAGEDTLVLEGSGIALDLTAIANTAIRGVETFDIRGDGANQLTLAFGDVKYNLGAGGTLRIVADADDEVTLAGSWTLVSSEGTVSTHSATSRGQTVFVEIDQAPADGLTIFAVNGPDSIVGGTGNDTVVFEDGTFDGSADFADGGDGTDTLVVDGTLLNMMEGTFAAFEKVEVRDGALFTANNDALAVEATSGNNETHLGNNSAQTYAGSDGVDTVHLGAAGQSVGTGMGDDIIRSTPARLAGSTLTAGEGMDTVMLDGNGAADLNDVAGSLADLERIELISTGISSLTLSDDGFDVVLQHPLTVEAGGGDDRFIFLSTNLFQGATVTLNGFTQGGADDVIQLLLTDLGDYQGEVAADGVDAALAASAGLRDMVFDTENGRLIVDYNQDDAYGAGDLTISLPGVSDLTAGADLILGAAGGQTYDAVDGPDSFTGGSGNDTINFGAGDFDADEDTIDGGGGFDTLALDGVTVDMGAAGFTGIERVELNNGASVHANAEALEVVAIAGGNEAFLGGNADQSYTGNASGDDVVLGAAGQEVHTGAGNDEVELANDQLAGSILDLGGDAFDQLHITGTGSASLLDAGSVSGGLRISYGNGITSLTLDNGGHSVFANANQDAALTSGDNSGGDDTFAFGSNDWAGRSMTIHEFLQGAGNDRIEINIVSFSGEYYGETDSAGVDALLPDDGLRNGVLDTELGALIVDYDRSGTYSAFGDLTVLLPGVNDLTAGSDITFF
jgi:Ca2+-binding RTX toxin-like protein